MDMEEYGENNTFIFNAGADCIFKKENTNLNFKEYWMEFKENLRETTPKKFWVFSASASRVMWATHMFIEPPTSETNLSFSSSTSSLCCRRCWDVEVISCNVCLFPLFHGGDALDCKAAQLADLHKHTSCGIWT